MRSTILAFTLFAALPLAAQTPESIIRHPAVQTTLQFIRDHESKVIEDQVRLCEIEAPPFQESRRAAAIKAEFERLGLQQVRVDQEGNVIGVRAGRGAKPNIVLSAHLDTVFPPGTNVKVKRNGSMLTAPGIGDDSRGLAALLGVIAAFRQSNLETGGTITFVATVGEEGLGDLRGVKHLFSTSLKNQIDAFLSIDGTGLTITNTGVGSYRYKVAYKGPGGHSYGAFGMANPIHALGRAIDKVADLQVPSTPKTTFNVGRVGGGTSVNSIAYEATMEVDMRSSSIEILNELDQRFRNALTLALNEENERWKNNGKLTLEVQRVGDRPAGRTPESSPIVQSAQAVNRALHASTALREGSTDANTPMNLGIPALTIGGGGRGAGAHSLGETFDTSDSYLGTQRAFLITLVLAGLAQR